MSCVRTFVYNRRKTHVLDVFGGILDPVGHRLNLDRYCDKEEIPVRTAAPVGDSGAGSDGNSYFVALFLMFLVAGFQYGKIEQILMCVYTRRRFRLL